MGSLSFLVSTDLTDANSYETVSAVVSAVTIVKSVDM